MGGKEDLDNGATCVLLSNGRDRVEMRIIAQEGFMAMWEPPREKQLHVTALKMSYDRHV